MGWEPRRMNMTRYNLTYEIYDMDTNDKFNDRMNMTGLKPFIRKTMKEQERWVAPNRDGTYNTYDNKTTTNSTKTWDDSSKQDNYTKSYNETCTTCNTTKFNTTNA